MISVEELARAVLNLNADLVNSNNWGERAIFYNPLGRLKKGRYVVTFKHRDGTHDRASALGSDGKRYRFNLGIEQPEYERLFGSRPKRPSAGGVIDYDCDFTQSSILMPHPVYGWMGWISVVNPERKMLPELLELSLSAIRRAAA
jgi:hypothetical protein